MWNRTQFSRKACFSPSANGGHRGQRRCHSSNRSPLRIRSQYPPCRCSSRSPRGSRHQRKGRGPGGRGGPRLRGRIDRQRGEREKMRAEHPAVAHPLVCTHAVTGRKHLYVNRVFADRIHGMDLEEGRDLIDRLCRAADTPEHQVRLRWEPDTVAFWANRAVQHYAASDYWPHVRIMERASIVGPRPAR
ncbi:TauD/TfdA family dioxygenase [Nocardia xishanensis]|uniref:TauD/TfdA dioxygenase family protein n=1 Tax=Nocardia xishanensis TaxID=238964 RepID=UPI00340F4229